MVAVNRAVHPDAVNAMVHLAEARGASRVVADAMQLLPGLKAAKTENTSKHLWFWFYGWPQQAVPTNTSYCPKLSHLVKSLVS